MEKDYKIVHFGTTNIHTTDGMKFSCITLKKNSFGISLTIDCVIEYKNGIELLYVSSPMYTTLVRFTSTSPCSIHHSRL